MEEHIENKLGSMTLEEKIRLLAGADQWHSHTLERLDIPALKMSDGPNGVRGEGRDTHEVTSASFPVGTAMGATWNPELIGQVGKALAEETKSKGAHVLLGPTVNMHRAPLAGRNFECFSEDPHLTARICVAYINGLQAEGIAACVKHFVCNDQEFERFSISAEVNERALREIYLPPFQAAVKEANSWTIMSAYNLVNGVHASENDTLLLDILKNEWGFDGLVISDWYGTYSDNVPAGGLDLEMPGPARWMGEKILEAVQSGQIDETQIDDKIRRLIRTLVRTNAFTQPAPSVEQSLDRPEHRQLIRKVGSEAIVLLKNKDKLLPIASGKIKKIALIGANAQKVSFQGGGSSQVNPHYVVSPLDAITARAGDDIQVDFALGCTVHKNTPPMGKDWLRSKDGTPGWLDVCYYDNPHLEGEPTHQARIRSSELSWFGEKAEHFDPNHFSARMDGDFQVPETGSYNFELGSVGRARVLIDDDYLLDLWNVTNTEPDQRHQQSLNLKLEGGKPYSLRIEYASIPGPRWRGVRLGCLPPLPEDPIAEAVALAKEADITIVVAGLTPEWESEGQDRINMDLPGEQNELIEQVAAANPNTVVVLNSGSPLHMPWVDKVKSVLQMWYLGQESGNAITDVLFGNTDPSGRLPTTFPKHIQDNPAFTNFPGENGIVHYEEGIFIGYRYYDKKGIDPLFPFGHGLSYTTFSYDALSVERVDDRIKIQLEVTNSGSRAGREVVQLYLQDLKSSLIRPSKELKAFVKITLEPGERQMVSLILKEADLAFYDDEKKSWVVEPGEFRVLIGRSAGDIRLSGQFTWQAE